MPSADLRNPPNASPPSLFKWFVFAILAAAAGCGGENSGDQTNSGGATSEGLPKVKLMLNWYPEAEHGGYYAALVHGFYEEAGVDVEIVPGGPNAPVVPQTARGAVQFGVTNADRIILARAEGAQLTALLAPLQTSPRCVLVHESLGLEKLEDLQGVTLMMRRENAWAQFLLTKLGDDVTVAPNTASLAPFLNDPKSAKQGYVISEPFVARREGAKVRALLVSELGFNPYTSVLMTTDDYESDNSELVRKVVEASRKGWEKYLEAPTEANEHIHQLNPEMGMDVLEFGVAAIKQHCLGEQDGGDLGTMKLERWRTMVNQLEQLKMIDSGAVDPKATFTDKYVQP